MVSVAKTMSKVNWAKEHKSYLKKLSMRCPKKFFIIPLLGNLGFLIGKELNSEMGYIPGKKEVTREPRSYGFVQSAYNRRN
jgi:hypothetical protein